MKKDTQEDFIGKSIKKWGYGMFSYDDLEYINSRADITLTCLIHNEKFIQKACFHKKYSGCKCCQRENISKSLKMPKEYFLKIVEEVWGDLYDLDKIVVEDGIITACCKKHGVFKKDFTNFKRGAGCGKCLETQPRQGVKKTKDTFILAAIITHGNKFLYDRVNYIDSNTKVEIYCTKCKKYFNQLPRLHLEGKGCKSCWQNNDNKKPKLNSRLTIQEIEKRCLLHYKDSLDFSESINNTQDKKIKVFCKICNNYSYQYVYNLLIGTGCSNGCHRLKTGSKAARYIENILNINDIVFEKEKTFPGCFYSKKLRFDFYIESLNLCIEYQGEQHYNAIEIFGGEDTLQKQIIRDNIKKEFCINNGIKLIEIKYNEDLVKATNKLIDFIKDINPDLQKKYINYRKASNLL